MSERERRNKDGEDKSHERGRMHQGFVDPKQNQDQPDVHQDQQEPDEFDRDLERDNQRKS